MVRFRDATAAQCRWIDSHDTKDPDLEVCGAPVQECSSYCPKHHALATIPGTAMPRWLAKQLRHLAKQPARRADADQIGLVEEAA